MRARSLLGVLALAVTAAPALADYNVSSPMMPDPYLLLQGSPITFAVGGHTLTIPEMQIESKGQVSPPSDGSLFHVSSFFDVFTELSIDGGPPVPSISPVTGDATYQETSPGSGTFSTEMLQLNISGMPSGIMLRESPTLQSTGQTTVRPVNGGYRISSFFDIFTEISLDGGASWVPAQTSSNFLGSDSPEPASLGLLGLGALGLLGRRRRA